MARTPKFGHASAARTIHAGRIGEVAAVMGVSRADAEHALSESNWDVDAAIDWLRHKMPIRR